LGKCEQEKETIELSSSSDEEMSFSSVTARPKAASGKENKPASAPKSMTNRTRLQCMNKIFDPNTTPNTKKHCRKLFEGIVANNAVVTAAINDLGELGVLSQDIVERTKLFLPPTPLNAEE
jgi:hypothetical protein